jgi:hypothetical protein
MTEGRAAALAIQRAAVEELTVDRLTGLAANGWR